MSRKKTYSKGKNIDLFSIGKRIKDLRGEKTQTKFANSLDFSQKYISDLECGKRSPSFEVIVAISVVHKVSLDWLVFGKE